jgi:NAD(P)-dependent dehydrogenase (short-subunit alcohol dehydrogenase family)
MTMLTNKTIAITGVSSGIGAAAARLMLARGATIVGFDRNPPDVPVAAFHQVDLGDRDDIETCVAGVGHGLHALVNCAGVPPTAHKQAVLAVNFFGLRHFTEAMAPRLAEGAAILNIASLAGFAWRSDMETVRAGLSTSFAEAPAWIAGQALEGGASYFLSKQLVIAWTLWTCQRWRDRGIRINSVSPGPVDTPILPDFIQTLGKRAEDDLKLNRAGTPDEIAPVIAFLCSDDARWINGTDISVDGGAGAAAWQQMLG